MGSWSAQYLSQQGYNVDSWSEQYLEYQDIEQSTRGYSRTETQRGKAKHEIKREMKRAKRKITKPFGTQSHKIVSGGKVVGKRSF